MSGPAHRPSNHLIETLNSSDRALIAPRLQRVRLTPGQALFEAGDKVETVHFPCSGTVTSLVLNLAEGVTAEAAMIGCEGAVGGVISHGQKPAFSRGAVEIEGAALRLPSEELERAKTRSPSLRDHFARYADCLLAQVLQSVACNAVHALDARLARWLLSTQDRTGTRSLPVTQTFVAEMLGVQRTYATRIIGQLERAGAIERRRGAIVVTDRGILEGRACECYGYLRRHFDRVLPGVYPCAA